MPILLAVTQDATEGWLFTLVIMWLSGNLGSLILLSIYTRVLCHRSLAHKKTKI